MNENDSINNIINKSDKQDYYDPYKPTIPEKKHNFRGKDGLEYETIEDLNKADQIYLESIFPKIDKEDNSYSAEEEVSHRRR